MSTKRRFTGEFKAKVALEALRGHKTHHQLLPSVLILHRYKSFSIARKAIQSALGDCGPVVSLKRRDGSKPLRRRPLQPMTV